MKIKLAKDLQMNGVNIMAGSVIDIPWHQAKRLSPDNIQIIPETAMLEPATETAISPKAKSRKVKSMEAK